MGSSPKEVNLAFGKLKQEIWNFKMLVLAIFSAQEARVLGS